MCASTAGRYGENVRSDCLVSFKPKPSGGIILDLLSKVESMYGSAIRTQVRNVLAALQVEHGRIEIRDAGALPFTIAARIETAVRRAAVGCGDMTAKQNKSAVRSPHLTADSDVTYLPDFKPFCKYPTTRDRLRRSRLYLPGNDPRYMISAGLHRPDTIILDLEDSVPASQKDAARILVRNALRQVDFHGAERTVRINQGESGLIDLDWIIPHNVHVVLIPKVESPEEVRVVDERIRTVLANQSQNRGQGTQVFLMPIIESALGAIKAYEIACASPNIVALSLGLEDYTADIGAQRTSEGRESFWMRSMVVNAARAAGVQPIDTVFSDIADMEGLRDSAIEAKSLGFEGKGCIHPRQIRVVHDGFAPTRQEIERATRIVLAFERAEKEGLGVVSLGAKMIDPPVVKRALKMVEMAEGLGTLHKNWRTLQTQKSAR